MRVGPILFTDRVYARGTGCTLCNAGVTLCTWIKGVASEIPACVSLLTTSIAPVTCFHLFFDIFHFLYIRMHFSHSPFCPSILSFDTVLMLYDWILCFVYINFIH